MKNFLKKLYSFSKQTKNYARVVGVGLFVLGLSGFIFRSSAIMPDFYLILAIAVGFWGIIVSLSEQK